MKRPRITIGMVMVGVLVIAADLALFRRAFANPFDCDTFKTVVSAPMTSLLLFALAIVWSDLRRRGEARSSAVGFCFVGAVMVIGFGWIWSDSKSIEAYLQWIAWPLEYWFPGWLNSLREEGQIVLASVALSIPQIALAAVGAMIATRIGLRLVIVPRSSRPSELPEMITAVVD
jgi:hypothetical protein